MTSLEARGVSVAFNGRRVLRDIDIKVEGGEILALLGASGVGKSTLLRVLHMLAQPDEGEVLIDGHAAPRSGASRRAALHRFALVQQRPGLLARSALENVVFPLRARGLPRAVAEARALVALARVGLAGLSANAAARLSGGEVQRVALARAIVTKPDFLLLDEATNQLDPETGHLVERVVMEEKVRGAAVLLVTHSPRQVARSADRLALMVDGRIVTEGPAGQLLHDPGDGPLGRYLAFA